MSDESKPTDKTLFRIAEIDFGNIVPRGLIDFSWLRSMQHSEVNAMLEGIGAMFQMAAAEEVRTGLATMAREAVAAAEMCGGLLHILMGEEGYKNALASRAVAGEYLRRSGVRHASEPQLIDALDIPM